MGCLYKALEAVLPRRKAAVVAGNVEIDTSAWDTRHLDGLHVPTTHFTDVGVTPTPAVERLFTRHGAVLVR